MIEVPCYGLHYDSDGVAWLMQRTGGVNAIGLKEACPFVMRTPHGVDAQCNHQVDLNTALPSEPEWRRFVMLLKQDTLLRSMVPDSVRSWVYSISSKDVKDAGLFGQMTSPIRAVVKPVWTLRTRFQLFAALSQTNIQPLVLTNVAVEDIALIREVVQNLHMLARQLIIVPENDDIPFPNGVVKINDRSDLSKYPPLPWKQLGTEYIRRIMRGEKL